MQNNEPLPLKYVDILKQDVIYYQYLRQYFYIFDVTFLLIIIICIVYVVVCTTQTTKTKRTFYFLS